ANHWVGDGRSRHVILSADLAEGCASRLGRHLAACGGDFDLLERSPPGQEPHLRITGSARDSAMKRDNWAAATGFLLASRGGGHVDDERLGALPAASGRGLSGHFVSLSLGN